MYVLCGVGNDGSVVNVVDVYFWCAGAVYEHSSSSSASSSSLSRTQPSQRITVMGHSDH